MGSETDSFQVHLQSLVDFATELETQLDALGLPTDQAAVLAGHEIELGAFTEAISLRSKHRQAATQMYQLLHNVREAIAFANDVTVTVADGYEKVDDAIAANYNSSFSAPNLGNGYNHSQGAYHGHGGRG